MNKVEIKIGNTQKTVTIVSRNSRKSISENDSEMDKRAAYAVKAAIKKAKVCKKPVAKYDVVQKKRISNMQMEQKNIFNKKNNP